MKPCNPMRISSSFSGARIGITLVLTVAFLGTSALLTVSHVRTIVQVRDVSVPLVAQVPVLERELSAIQEQAELAELHASARTGSLEEQIRIYVLPERVHLDRLLLTYELLRDHLQKQGKLAGESTVAVGGEVASAAEIHESPLRTQPLTMRGSFSEDGFRALNAFVKLAGVLTVGDAIEDGERRMLLLKTEEENPAGVTALEQFFATDLLSYARAPHIVEERLLRSFSSDGFHQALRSSTQSPLLRDARDLLGGDFGVILERNNLWPLPFLSMHRVELVRGGAPGWYRVELVVLAYARG